MLCQQKNTANRLEAGRVGVGALPFPPLVDSIENVVVEVHGPNLSPGARLVKWFDIKISLANINVVEYLGVELAVDQRDCYFYSQVGYHRV